MLSLLQFIHQLLHGDLRLYFMPVCLCEQVRSWPNFRLTMHDDDGRWCARMCHENGMEWIYFQFWKSTTIKNYVCPIHLAILTIYSFAHVRLADEFATFAIRTHRPQSVDCQHSDRIAQRMMTRADALCHILITQKTSILANSLNRHAKYEERVVQSTHSECYYSTVIISLNK